MIFLNFILGFGAIVLVSRERTYHVSNDIKNALLGGDNMPAIHLAQAVGGDLMKGFIAAVGFRDRPGGRPGLTLFGASAVSHDLYASVSGAGMSMKPRKCESSRITTVVLGIVAVLLGIVFEKINVAFMVGLAFAVAAAPNSRCFCSPCCGRDDHRGAFHRGFVGLISALVLTMSRTLATGKPVFGYPKGSGVASLRVAGAVHHPRLSFFCCW